MPQLINFRGAATAGLFVYFMIYAGMLGYATVAFDKKPESEIAQQGQTVMADNAGTDLAVAADAKELPVANAELQPVSEQVQISPEVVEAPSVVTSADTSEVAVASESEIIKPVPQEVLVSVAGAEKNTDHINTQQSSTHAQYIQAMNNYAQYATTNGRGNGRGRGAMNGEGDFGFSMKFKSRARMDADSAIDGSLQNTYYADQRMNYAQQHMAQPAYQYYYYQ